MTIDPADPREEVRDGPGVRVSVPQANGSGTHPAAGAPASGTGAVRDDGRGSTGTLERRDSAAVESTPQRPSGDHSAHHVLRHPRDLLMIRAGTQGLTATHVRVRVRVRQT